MTNLNLIENQISQTEKYLKLLAYYQKLPEQKLESDPYLRGGLERYLYLVTQSAIDLSEAIIAYKKLRKPITLAESFEILAEEKIISQQSAEKLIRMVGFRNIIAHNYTELDYKIVFDVLHHRLEDIRDFLRSIRKVL